MSSAENAAAKMIVLESSDGETFEVEEAVGWEMIKHVFEDASDLTSIRLPNVTSTILAKVIEYCKRHVDAAAKSASDVALTSVDKVADEDLKAFDAEFVKVDHPTLFDLILAANYLNIKSLLDLTCQAVADMIKGRQHRKYARFSIARNTLPPRMTKRFAGRTHGLSSEMSNL